MNTAVLYFKNRLTALNVIRLLLAVTFAGEAINSGSYWLLGITLLFIYQITQNKTCGPNGCTIPEK